MTKYEDYFKYLQQRSLLGLAYRRYLVYPRICGCLSGRVLDIGCGLGDMLRYRFGTVGVDINPHAVDWCRRQGYEAHLMKPNILPFNNGEFRGAILDNVLEHLAEPLHLLMEINRVLEANAILIVGVPGQRGYASDPDHKVYYNSNKLVSTLALAGFRKQDIFHLPFCSQWLNKNMRQYCIYGIFRNEDVRPKSGEAGN